MSPTPHFTPELFKFLRTLKRNNKREWFNDKKNKDRYIEHVRDPMLRFIEDFRPRLLKINRHFVADPSPVGGSMFRIYRDTRFSKDKTPYKLHASAQFRHEMGRDVHAPGFYMHLGLDGVFLAAGIWHPDSSSLGKIRQAIDEKPAAWKRVVNGPAFKSGGFRLAGESLKRPPRGYDAEHPLIDDLKRKDFIAVADLDEQVVTADDFMDRVVDHFKASKPVVKFLTEALELQF